MLSTLIFKIVPCTKFIYSLFILQINRFVRLRIFTMFYNYTKPVHWHHLNIKIQIAAMNVCSIFLWLSWASLESALAWHSASSARSCRSGILRPSWSLQDASRTALLNSAPASFSCNQRRSHAPSHASSHSHSNGFPVKIKPPGCFRTEY